MVGDDKEAERNIKIFLNFHELERQDGNLVPYEFEQVFNLLNPKVEGGGAHTYVDDRF